MGFCCSGNPPSNLCPGLPSQLSVVTRAGSADFGRVFLGRGPSFKLVSHALAKRFVREPHQSALAFKWAIFCGGLGREGEAGHLSDEAGPGRGFLGGGKSIKMRGALPKPRPRGGLKWPQVKRMIGVGAEQV